MNLENTEEYQQLNDKEKEILVNEMKKAVTEIKKEFNKVDDEILIEATRTVIGDYLFIECKKNLSVLTWKQIVFYYEKEKWYQKEAESYYTDKLSIQKLSRIYNIPEEDLDDLFYCWDTNDGETFLKMLDSFEWHGRLARNMTFIFYRDVLRYIAQNK